jgi:serpin B
MKSKSILYVLSFVFVFFISCKKAEAPDIEVKSTQKSIIAKSNDFGVDILKLVYEQEDEKENLMISPYSVSMALGMALNGADNNTEKQMQDMLGFSSMSLQQINEAYKTIMDYLLKADDEVEMAIANSIWQEETFSVKQDFLDLNKRYFNAECNARDFSSSNTVNEINAWCADKTNDKIKKVVDQISPATVMFLINAIYFNGNWKYQFDEESVLEQVFTNDEGEEFNVDMMQQEASLNYYSNDEIQMVELPYGNEKFAMQVILPVGDRKLDDLFEDLSASKLNSWIEGLNSQEVVMSLPKFKFKYKERLNDMLKAMGMTDAFVGGIADFSGITEKEDLFISFVDHFTFIDVNTEGTEAAAVTVIGFETTSVGGDDKKYFTANRPFMFTITEKETNTILFAGSVKHPEYE